MRCFINGSCSHYDIGIVRKVYAPIPKNIGSACAAAIKKIHASAGPVEDGHKVVADDLDTELGQVADALLVVLDVLIAGPYG